MRLRDQGNNTVHHLVHHAHTTRTREGLDSPRAASRPFEVPLRMLSALQR